MLLLLSIYMPTDELLKLFMLLTEPLSTVIFVLLSTISCIISATFREEFVTSTVIDPAASELSLNNPALRCPSPLY